MAYKYYLSVTSQAPFCSTPLRLDAYSACQFGCAYCFAKSRGGNISSSQLRIADAKTLQDRLARVRRGELCSALDELLARRVPIQFGGMTDPFSPWELRHSASLSLLSVLCDDDYPTLISTKSTIPALAEYADVLSRGNFYIRFSITGADEGLTRELEAGVASPTERLAALGTLAQKGVATSVRLQPLIVGHEDAAVDIIRAASEHGAKHVSAEYLKLPVEKALSQAKSLDRVLPRIRSEYISKGARRVGREYLLPAEEKLAGHEKLAVAANDVGLLYGYADNEFLLRNNFTSCCNASDQFLRGTSMFQGNILSTIKSSACSDIRFVELNLDHVTEFPMDNYLNSRSRVKLPSSATPKERWIALLRKKWNAPSWRGGPASFWGIVDTGKVDQNGDKIFKNIDTQSQQSLSSGSKTIASKTSMRSLNLT